MKKKIINQLIAAALVCGSLLSVGNLPAYAENKKDVKFTKTWVLEGDKNGSVWHYYNENGQIAKNTTIIGPNNKTEVKIDENGVGQVDWEYGVDSKFENEKRYYVNASGKKTGWLKINIKCIITMKKEYLLVRMGMISSME